MAIIPVGTRVTLADHASRALRHPPPAGAELRVSVHPASLRAGRNPHTQLAGLAGGKVVWLGALGEDLLREERDRPDATVRRKVQGCMLSGPRLWEIVRPGELLHAGVRAPLSTVYDGARPWLVIGETPAGDPIAVPLNSASNPKWYTPVVPRLAMTFPGNDRDSQVELPHAWTLPASVPTAGRVSPRAAADLEDNVRQYFGFGA